MEEIVPPDSSDYGSPKLPEPAIPLTPHEELDHSSHMDLAQTNHPLPAPHPPFPLDLPQDTNFSTLALSPSQRSLSLYYHNMSGLRSKLPDFRNDLANCPFDAVLITET